MLKTFPWQSQDAPPRLCASQAQALETARVLCKPVREKGCSLGPCWEGSNETNGASVDTESQRTGGIRGALFDRAFL